MINNSKGYTIKEILILCGLLAIIFGVAISKVSYAYDEIDNTEELNETSVKHVEQAAKIYVHDHKEEFKEEETYIYGSDLISADYITGLPGVDVSNIKIKVTHLKDSDEYKVEIER